MSELVIFDLDDTLADTTAALNRARKRVLQRVFGALSRDQILAAGNNWRVGTWLYGDLSLGRILALISVALELTLPSVLDEPELVDFYRSLELQFLSVNPGMVEAAVLLAGRGLGIGIVSNGTPSHQHAKIEKLQLEVVAGSDAVICDDVSIPFKPSPEGILQMMSTRRATNVVAVGDRNTDVVAARLAGVKAVQVRRRTVVTEPLFQGANLITQADAVADETNVQFHIERLLRA
jgi:FMN phosphatase YigB (HAD superfamily)